MSDENLNEFWNQQSLSVDWVSCCVKLPVGTIFVRGDRFQWVDGSLGLISDATIGEVVSAQSARSGYAYYRPIASAHIRKIKLNGDFYRRLLVGEIVEAEDTPLLRREDIVAPGMSITNGILMYRKIVDWRRIWHTSQPAPVTAPEKDPDTLEHEKMMKFFFGKGHV